MAANGCFIAVLIARSSDRIPLCSFIDENYSNSNQICQQQQRVLECIGSPVAVSDKGRAAENCYQSFDHRDCIYFAFQDPATDLTIITVLNKLLIRNSNDLPTTNRLACSLLDLIFAEFTQRFTVSEITAATVRPYQFIKFESVLQRLILQVQRDRQEGVISGCSGAVHSSLQRRQASSQYDTLRQELTDVRVVMRKNLEDLMTRGEKLETMNHFSAQLVNESSRFYKKTVQMNRMRLLRLYGPPAVVIGLLFIFFYFYLF
ncbi:putative Synaptobrevin [Trypanosoma vivax]|nr:putative Synaptobrevin [Trypanosoma vivax]